MVTLRVGGADDLLDRLLDLRDDGLGLLEARADGRANEDRELAGIDAREELGAELPETPDGGTGGRVSGEFYPSCEARCRPILGFMLCGLKE